MTGFASSWLDLREPADAACRSIALGRRLATHLASLERITVADLGAGTGANLRWLAPWLPRDQRWHLLEQDPALLGDIAPRLRAWGKRNELHATPRNDGIALVGRQALQVSWQRSDLNEDPLPVAPVHLVTASALTDLVSDRWLTRLATRCARARCAVLLAINYDGRLAMRPRHALDRRVRDAQNLHQLGDKGFGPALGPSAAARATRCFQAHGYRVLQARSDWVLTGDRAPLLRELLGGWRRSARDVLPHDTAEALDAWHAWHVGHLARGESRVRVGHVDLLALPAS